MPKSFVLNFEDNKPAPCAFVGSITENLPEDVADIGYYAVLRIDTSLLEQYIKQKYEDSNIAIAAEEDPNDYHVIMIKFAPIGGGGDSN